MNVRLTRIGWSAIFACLAVALAAVNTGNNLLYLVLGLVLAAFPVSYWFSRKALRSLRAELLPPEDARSGEPFDIAVSVAGERAVPGVVVEVAWSAALAPPAPRSLPLLREGERSMSLSATAPYRGDLGLELQLRSPFPFGLLDARRRVADATVTILPVPDPSWRQDMRSTIEEGRPRLERGLGAEIFEIRDHRAGDDARRIDWKATARLDRPMVREFARDESRRALVVVDAVRVPAGVDRSAAGERAISRAAAAIEALHEEGWRVALLLPDGRREGSPRALLRELARLIVAHASSEGWWVGQAAEGEVSLVFRSVA